MLCFEILKTPVQIQKQTEVSTPPEDREKVFQRHLNRCHFKVGDKVFFKRPKRNRPWGILKEIVTDTEKMHWSKGGQPLYLKIEMGNSKPTSSPLIVWTFESKLVKGT